MKRLNRKNLFVSVLASVIGAICFWVSIIGGNFFLMSFVGVCSSSSVIFYKFSCVEYEVEREMKKLKRDLE